MTMVPQPSEHARRLVAALILRIAEAERSQRFKSDVGAALAEMGEAAGPLLGYVATLEARVRDLEEANATLWTNLRPGRRLVERRELYLAGRARGPSPLPDIEPDETERASEPSEPRPDVEAPEWREQHDPESGFSRTRRV